MILSESEQSFGTGERHRFEWSRKNSVTYWEGTTGTGSWSRFLLSVL